MSCAQKHLPVQTIEALYDAHHAWLVGWLRRRSDSPADAADLAQDTFMRVLTRPDPLSLAELQAPRAYLATIAKRLRINLYRRRSLEQAYLDTLASLSEEERGTMEDSARILDALMDLDRVLCHLPRRARRVFLMANLEGYSQEEIAIQLGVTVRTVQRDLMRVLEKSILLALCQDSLA